MLIDYIAPLRAIFNRPLEVEVDPDDYTTPYKYAQEVQLRPQLMYYFIRQRGAPHKVINGKLLVSVILMNDWLNLYIENRFMRTKQVKHEHGPECTEGEITASNNGAAPTLINHFLHVEAQGRRKRGARQGAQRSIREFEDLIDEVNQVED